MFAAYLNISVSAIRKWETGEKKPGGLALRLLNLIEKKDYRHSLIKERWQIKFCLSAKCVNFFGLLVGHPVANL